MATETLLVHFLLANSIFAPWACIPGPDTDASFVAYVQAAGSGDWIQGGGLAPGLAYIEYRMFATSIDGTNTITNVEIQIDIAAFAIEPGFPITVALRSNEFYEYWSTTFTVSADFALFTIELPQRPTSTGPVDWTADDYFFFEENMYIEAQADPTGGRVGVDFLQITATYHPTPTAPKYCMTWVSRWTPPGCDRPPSWQFKPFEIFQDTDLNPATVTAAYARRFGQPPSGATLWLICRSLTEDLQPNANSPLTSFVVP